MRTINVDDLKDRIDSSFSCQGLSCNGVTSKHLCIFNTKHNCGGTDNAVNFQAIKIHNFGAIKNISIKMLKKFLKTYKVEDYATD